MGPVPDPLASPRRAQDRARYDASRLIVALARTALPVVALVAFATTTLAILASAGSTWGYDFQAYAHAAQRILDGQRLYDPGVDLAGGFAIYLYPPPFAIAFIPLTWLGDPVGLYFWTALLVGSTVLAIAAMPVSATLRWILRLRAGLDWPVLYSIKLGQVGPILLLLFVLGWRWLERPIGIGVTIGLGTLIKVQPALLGGWAALTGRWRAALVALGIAAAPCLVTLPIVGLGAWADYVALLRQVSEPVATPHNFTPGAVLYQAGMDSAVASMVQWITVGGSLLLVVVAARWRSVSASFVVAVVASQLISPLLWDHYAVVLLLPVAWVAARGAWWALAIPIATSLPLLWLMPPAIYPIEFVVALVAPVLVDRDRRVAAPS
jgi:alpha-1,2-mannosyltransferase